MIGDNFGLKIRHIIWRYNLPLPFASVYWILFAFSDGSLEFYGPPVRIFFSAVLYNGNFHDFLLLSGIYWFPSSHFGFSFPLFQTAVSLLMSLGIWIILRDFSISGFHYIRKNASAVGSAITGVVITTGACCTVPFIFPLLSIISQSFALGSLVFLGTYSYIMDLFIFALIMFMHIQITERNNPREYC